MRKKLAAVAGVAIVAGLLGAIAVVFGVSSSGDSRAPAERVETPPLDARGATTLSAESEEATVAAGVEVPKLSGRTLAEAQVLLAALDLGVEVIEDASVPADAVGDARIVATQRPEAGFVSRAGTIVTLVVPACSLSADREVVAGYVVVIDPGHQSRGDNTPEPIGPGATERKPRVTGGTTGVVTGLPEYEVVLQIAMNLKARLEHAGVRVVMTRTTNDVNISNAERARIANDAGAHLFVRIHADGNIDPEQAGLTVLYPASNRWTAQIAAESQAAAMTLHDAMIAATGAPSRGTVARDDLSGFNWSRVPVVLVECGFLTNPVEDRLLSSPHYQDRLAEGMTAGILSHLSD
ncbi:MAG TPA: N-acetylmuramoyl-L-alanine amidase [Coriobacteriia bacterium]|nr:N-acetylmuramoyl-L-alanine amidase [Coriobacteriia bacterium]